MAFQILKSEATAANKRIPFLMVNAADGHTPMTGLTFTGSQILVYENTTTGNSFAGTSTEIGNGLYYYTPSTGELGTLGFLLLYITNTNCLPAIKEVQIVAYDPYNMPVQFADEMLIRDITAAAQGNQAQFSLLNAILKAVSKVVTSGSSIITYETDGSTTAMTQAITTNVADLPIDSIGINTTSP